jgi:hypothetical protein
VIGDSGAQLSRVNVNDGVVDVQDEEYEIIPGGQETNDRANGVSRSDRAVSSTLSSKAGIILVSLPSFLFFIFIYFISQRVFTTSSLSFPNSLLPDSRLSYLP